MNKKLHEENSNLVVCWLEDGAYYSVESSITNFKNNSIKTSIRNEIGKIVFGKYYSFSGAGICTSKWTDYCCFTYPEAVRTKYSGKKYIEVSDESFQYGMMSLYNSESTHLPNDSIMLIVDKIDRYNSIASVTTVVKKLVDLCKERHITLYYKYHPREDRRINCLDQNCVEIDRSIGAEGIYATNIGKHLVIAGIASTGLQTACKCGFEVYSFARITGESNDDLVSFYEKIGIKVLDQVDELFCSR